MQWCLTDGVFRLPRNGKMDEKNEKHMRGIREIERYREQFLFRRVPHYFFSSLIATAP